MRGGEEALSTQPPEEVVRVIILLCPLGWSHWDMQPLAAFGAKVPNQCLSGPSLLLVGCYSREWPVAVVGRLCEGWQGLHDHLAWSAFTAQAETESPHR